ncbi:MAG: tripartite tricarboxylate transporter TctB family protein [Deltaproteobacteria bacterium]|nr:tripartite tricarboxylate transporter TctB family protein [Deltaproteobacteria bacterium]MBI2229791.1 tripartite tricarboxylate transporter TctB family protein [Deltaproteobacteria bacterium]MBI2363988.1 tripartite tricarboxylate transporter TctB family protein [Deltaproteobacteria bacterium]
MGEKKELLSGICLGAFGAYVSIEALNLPYVSEFGPGPGFFPLWIGIGLTLLSLLLILANFFALTPDESRERQSRLSIGRALVGWSGLILAIGLLQWLGFGLSLALLTLFLILVLERRPLWTALSVAIGLALGFHVIFVLALGLSLPSGPWGF